jgi:hypothetical protein
MAGTRSVARSAAATGCGLAWRIVRTPNVAGTGNALKGVAAVAPDDVWAVGSSGAVGSRRTLVQHWDGASWSIVPSPSPSVADNTLNAITVVSANDIWAVGSAGENTLVLHWDGTQWRVTPSPNAVPGGNYLYGVSATSPDHVWAVGYYDTGTSFQTLVLRWDGAQWAVQPSPNVEQATNEFLGIDALSDHDAWAVGSYAQGSVLGTLVGHWDGSQWSIVPSPSAGFWATLMDVAAVSPGDVWAVGGYYGDGPQEVLVEHWDGAGWSLVASAKAGPWSMLTSVAAIGAGDVWAVGQNLKTSSTIVEHWDGGQWNLVPSPGGEGSNNLNGVEAVSPRDVWAVGEYVDSSTLPRTLALRYNDPCDAGTATPTSTSTSVPPTLTPTATLTSTPVSCGISFSDVLAADYFYEAVRRLYCRGAISGYADNTFRPYNDTTRGQLSKIVTLSEGWSIDLSGAPHFSDVPAANPFYNYIETAYNHGAISGYDDGTFRWSRNVTRAQSAKIIVLAHGWVVDAPSGPHFRDVPAANPFYTYIETAYDRGLISGYDCGNPGEPCPGLYFRPGNAATRGQIVKIIMNFEFCGFYMDAC